MRTFMVEIEDDEIRDIRGDLEREGQDTNGWEDHMVVANALPFCSKVREMKAEQPNGIKGLAWGLLLSTIITACGFGLFKIGEYVGHTSVVCGG